MNQPHIVQYKPLSINECWKGERYKTDSYKKYERDLLFILPRLTLPDPPFRLELTFGLSNMASDFDNPVKPFVDILQKKYRFNDKLIMQSLVTKKIVKKGSEYVEFRLVHFE